MNPLSLRTLALLAVVLLAAGAVSAQAPAASPSPSPSPGAGSQTIQSILDQELEPPPGGYTYNPQGRRDPFVSLQRPVAPDEARIKDPKTPEGMLIAEVALKGIVRTPKGYVAMLLGPGNRSYFVSVGQKLFDGVVVAIDARTVTFQQQVTDPLSPVKSREVKKTLYPSEEARQ